MGCRAVVETIDWYVLALYGVVAVVVGIRAGRRGSDSTDEYFLGGRRFPWWVAGTSIAATTFASDTPLWLTDLVRQKGVSGVWFEWAPLAGALVAIAFVSRLYRRARVVTDAEFIELRYPQDPVARWLRPGIGLFNALVINAIVIGWVVGSMGFWAEVVLGLDVTVTVIGATALAMAYSLFGGLRGVVATDVLQFAVAGGGAVLLAAISLITVGGPATLAQELETARPAMTSIVPDASLSVVLLLLFQATFGMDTRGYYAQRLFASRSEQDAQKAVTLLYTVRTVVVVWAWVVVALCSVVLLPDIDGQLAYPTMVQQMLPPGLRGLLMAAIVAAFMSTMDTHLNWGASYIVIDVYKRFIRPDATTAQSLWVARAAVVLFAIVGIYLALQLDSILGNVQFVFTMLTTLAAPQVLRWFWWRVSARSELAVLTVAALFAPLLELVWLPGQANYSYRLAITCTTGYFATVVVSLLWAPDPKSLVPFYERLRPPGAWGPVRRLAGPTDERPWAGTGTLMLFTAGLVYGTLFGLWAWLFGPLPLAIALSALTLFSLARLRAGYRSAEATAGVTTVERG